MKLKTVLEKYHSSLDECYGKEEVNSFFYLLLEYFMGLKRIALALNPEYVIGEEESQRFSSALEELKHYKPIQYIIGETEFFGLSFKVNKYTLIPRPETEELVDWIIKRLSEQSEKSVRILDIGTGTGCIAISLAKNLPNARVSALDISEKALEIAKDNADQNEVEIEFIQDDILNLRHSELFSQPYNYNVIVSNPPYVRHSEKSEIKANVLEHEPHIALFVDDENPLRFYEAICEFAKHQLSNNGLLYFEINEYLGEEMIQLLNNYGFNKVELKQDIFGKDRMIRAFKKS